MIEMKIGDFDIWYKPCESCGYDTGKSNISEPNKRCWRCGHLIHRDFSHRALKEKNEPLATE